MLRVLGVSMVEEYEEAEEKEKPDHARDSSDDTEAVSWEKRRSGCAGVTTDSSHYLTLRCWKSWSDADVFVYALFCKLYRNLKVKFFNSALEKKPSYKGSKRFLISSK